MHFIKKIQKKHNFRRFQLDFKPQNENHQRKVDQDGIWDFLNQKKYSDWFHDLGYDAKMTSKMTSFGQF